MVTHTSLLIFTVFTFCTFISAQEKRFFYEHTFAEDSTNSSIQKKEIMVLDVDKEGSKYYAYLITEEDSLRKIKETRPGKYLYQGIENDDVVAKIYSPFEYNLYTNLLAVNYKIVFRKDLDWRIENETKKINGYPVQKATVILYNRKWIAWFTPEISIQDGPYLFHGLPGLIVKIEDEKQTHVIELIEIKNLKDYSKGFIPYYFDKRLLTIDEKQWQKLLTDFRDNPYASDYADKNPNTTYHLQDGTVVSKAEFFRMQENSLKQTRKKSNNQLRFELIR